MSSEFRVSCSENSEKSLEKVVGGWVDSEGYRGVRRYPVWYISGIKQVQKRGQDTGCTGSLSPVFGLRKAVATALLTKAADTSVHQQEITQNHC